MSSSVTPARRRRAEEDEEDGDSTDERDSLYSGTSKRARLDGEDRADEQSESSQGALLPDSYRRSPHGKKRARDLHTRSSADDPESQLHPPGSIVRVTLINFVTYTNAEFHPGPNLNMIIGPNGTGKSTLVCAICLGLGWATSHLGRAKDLGEFVKHGSRKAEIHIELAADPERHDANPVITTRIIREGNKSEYYINDKKSNRKGVQALARSFSIQVDNLCQFLPQDRVVEFAALSPVDLLTQTQRAAAPEYMIEWHDELKRMRKDQKQLQCELVNVNDNLKNMENRQRLQEADVVRLRERAQMQERKGALDKMRPFARYLEAKAEFANAKGQHKEAAKDLNRLARNLEPNLRAVEDKKQYLEAVEKVVKQRQGLVQRSEATVGGLRRMIDTTQTTIQECLEEIGREKQGVRDANRAILRHKLSIQRLTNAINNPPPDFDAAEINEQIRDMTRQNRELDVKKNEINDSLAALAAQRDQLRERITAKEQEKENLQSQAGQQASKLKQKSSQSARAWEWIQNNPHRFEGKVYGPPLMECSVKDKNYANAVEAMIPLSEMLAFTVTTKADFKTLSDQVYGEMKLTDVRLRNCPQSLETFQPAIPKEQLRQLGLDCYILELIEGPDAVLAMLCDNRNLHQAAYASRDLNGPAADRQLEDIRKTNISSWVTPKEIHIITRRREYGDDGHSTRVNKIRNAEFFTDVPVDRQIEMDLDREIREANGDIEVIGQEASSLVEERKVVQQKITTIQAEKKELDQDKQDKQRAKTEYDALPVKRDQAQRKLDEAKAAVTDFQNRQREIEERQDTHCLEKGQQALDLANAVEAQRGLHMKLFEGEILRIEAKSDVEQLEAQHAEEQGMLQERTVEVERLQTLKARLHTQATDMRDACMKISEGFGEFENEIYQEIMEWTSDQLETEIQATQARLEMTLGGGNQNTLREFEKRAKDIEDKRKKLEDMKSRLEGVGAGIVNVRQRWEPELDALICKISDAFGENFAHIQCAGEVAVHKDEDFENWAIQIKVKFRENEGMSILDSHRQSGGERAVSTIFYLMALQSLARAPFRVVDEINQGMDPRNERMVHSRMVDIACAEHTSQYFLITPKLLQGLKYHPGMKVHCIASGEYMPPDHHGLDFGKLAKKALEKRQSSAAMSA